MKQKYVKSALRVQRPGAASLRSLKGVLPPIKER